MTLITSLFAKEITLGTSDAPPYMIKSDNSGIDIEITKTVLESMGYNVKVKYYSLGRAKQELEEKNIDAMVPLFAAADSEKIIVSNPHVMYRPTAFSLTKRELDIKEIKDLGKYNVMTFQGAKGYFGDDFLKYVSNSAHYKEYFDMTRLAKILYRNRTEVVILDYNIFFYYYKKIKDKEKYKKIVVHDIFEKVPAVVGFHNKKLRDDFNKELKIFYQTGKQRKVIQKYIRD